MWSDNPSWWYWILTTWTWGWCWLFLLMLLSKKLCQRDSWCLRRWKRSFYHLFKEQPMNMSWKVDGVKKKLPSKNESERKFQRTKGKFNIRDRNKWKETIPKYTRIRIQLESQQDWIGSTINLPSKNIATC